MTVGDWISLGGVTVAAAAVIVAFAAMIWQATQTHASNSISNMWRFVDTWDSSGMHVIRARACESLKTRGDADEIVDLLGFFEELGYLVHHRGLDAGTAWAMFSDWSLPYWKAAEYYISRDQHDDPTLWEEFAFLNRKLLKIESHRRHKPITEIQPKQDDVDALIQAEIRLAVAPNELLAPGVEGAEPSQRTFSAWRRRKMGRPRAKTSGS